MRHIEFTIPHVPVPEGRARAYRAGGFIRVVTPEKTRHYRALVAEAANAACGALEPLDGPIELRVVFWMPVPAKMSQKARQALLGRFQSRKPDADNLLKALQDGMTGIMWVDDCQVARVVAEKRYSDEPRTDVVIQEISE